MFGSAKIKKKISSSQVIILGFTGVILLGAFLLMLPFSSREGRVTSFFDALFTATSAVCVTGLVVRDTATYWSVFGQAIILLLIQIGGMGVITVAASFSMFSGKKISLMQRSTMQEAISAPTLNGIVRLTGFIIKGTLLIELVGALAMVPVFYQDFGSRGIWMAFFHSISAFCNAGFDLMGTPGGEFASLTRYNVQPLINVVVMLLIIIGGIGFLTWEDICTNKLRFRKYRMQTKVILSTTALLLIVPWLFYFFIEFSDQSMKERVFHSLFQTVTPRTAGFNTVDLTTLSDPGQWITLFLMLIGGCPGSTAGGMKTTTLAVLLCSAVATFRQKEDTQMFGRRIDISAVRNAATILMMYLTLFFFGALVISTVEGLPMFSCLFETASAVGTVGLSLGLTPSLGAVSRIILILLMFFGRVGGLTLIFAAFSGVKKTPSRLPQEKITVG